MFMVKIIILLYLSTVVQSIYQPDANGYIVYCPCMGRFGNQAEQLLGTLLFAKSLNRTLVLPPFIHYGNHHSPKLVPFDNVIQSQPINNYHRVILFKDFLNNVANKIWTAGNRRFFCYSRRAKLTKQTSCDALYGEPFRTFWSSFNVSEDFSTFYSPLATNPDQASDWKKNYPASKFKVLTFVGAPSPFPTHKESIFIQKYIKLSDKVKESATLFRKSKRFEDKRYISIHVRHGSDWKQACRLVNEKDGFKQLFSSAQCTGYPVSNSEPLGEKIKFETCFPSNDDVIDKVNQILKAYFTRTNVKISTLHMATDLEDSELVERLKLRIPNLDIVLTERSDESFLNTLIDIYLMTYSNVFIGNCVSSFSAFAARLRQTQLSSNNYSTYYFGQDFNSKNIYGQYRDEL